MAKTAIKIGQMLNIKPTDPGFDGVRLRAQPEHNAAVISYTRSSKVRVIRINAIRPHMLNSWWIEVEDPQDPLRRGWIAYDPCGPNKAIRTTISCIVFVERATSKPKFGGKCE